MQRYKKWCRLKPSSETKTVCPVQKYINVNQDILLLSKKIFSGGFNLSFSLYRDNIFYSKHSHYIFLFLDLTKERLYKIVCRFPIMYMCFPPNEHLYLGLLTAV